MTLVFSPLNLNGIITCNFPEYKKNLAFTPNFTSILNTLTKL